MSVYPLTTNAATAEVDRVNIEIDVPVDGIKLPEKVSVDYFCDAQNAAFPSASSPMKVDSVVWYIDNSGVPLADNYKAKLGETYTLMVVLVPDNGYKCSSSMLSAANKINGKSASTTLYGEDYWTFSVNFATIPSVSGKPVISVKKLNLTPYEGDPVEIQIEATGTNLKYQWQIGWASGSWAPMVDVDDNAAYGGTKTNNFKIYTFFGDSFDQNGLDVRCRVTGDNGETYSQVFNFTFIDRTVVPKAEINGVDIPVSGNVPDYSATTSSSEYSVSQIEWYEKSGTELIKMYSSQRFVSGEYICRIHILPDKPFRFDDNTEVKINGVNRTLNTIDGSTLYPYGADKYFVDIPYNVELIPDVINTIKANVTAPVAGALPDSTVTPAGEGYKTIDVDWSYYDEKYDEYYIMPDGMTFEAGKTYECAVQFEALDEYTFPENKADIKGYINGIQGVISPVYYTHKAYVTVKFTVPEVNPFKVIFTEDSKAQAGSKLTVDLEAMAEMDEEFMEAYFNDDIVCKWFFDGKLFGISDTFECKSGMVGHYVGVRVNYGDKFVSSEGFVIAEAPAVAGILGDADEDDEVNIKDATAIQKHIAGLIKLSKTGEKLADVDGSGDVNIKDATVIQKFIAGMDTGFAIGKEI